MASPIYISFAGSDAKNGDFSNLKALATSGASDTWSSLKGVQPGERVLIYCQSPHSAIVATAETTTASRPGKRWPFEATIRSVTMLEKPISRAEIAKRFPEWPWAKATRGKVRPSEDIAEWLWNRAGIVPSEPEVELVFKAGAGFGDPLNNRKVEVAAVMFATAQLEAEGYEVRSREPEKIGYDLEAKKRGSTLHVEVKGVSGGLWIPFLGLSWRRMRRLPLGSKRWALRTFSSEACPKPACRPTLLTQAYAYRSFPPRAHLC